MFIKKICKKLTINDASEGTLTSYSINLMLINYLQTRTPPILPVLQVLDEEINISEDLENLPRRIRQVPEVDLNSDSKVKFDFRNGKLKTQPLSVSSPSAFSTTIISLISTKLSRRDLVSP